MKDDERISKQSEKKQRPGQGHSTNAQWPRKDLKLWKILSGVENSTRGKGSVIYLKKRERYKFMLFVEGGILKDYEGNDKEYRNKFRSDHQHLCDGSNMGACMRGMMGVSTTTQADNTCQAQ